jgi:peptidyl-prolyl cis-trans isomerase A (cyclophilin A)
VAPASVANVLAYVASDRHDGSLVHRSAPGFVIQGGGTYADFSPVPGFSPVANEASLSNLRGTLATAHSGLSVNDATSPWFINLADNVFLDPGRRTVFGVVTDNGMQVVDAIASLPICNYSAANPALSELPVRHFNPALGLPPGSQSLVTVDVSAVPEPATATLFMGGLMALLAGSWRRIGERLAAGSRQVLVKALPGPAMLRAP